VYLRQRYFLYFYTHHTHTRLSSATHTPRVLHTIYGCRGITRTAYRVLYAIFTRDTLAAETAAHWRTRGAAPAPLFALKRWARTLRLLRLLPLPAAGFKV